MFNKQLKANIKAMDKHIGKLMQELVVEPHSDTYEEIQSKIDDMTKVRTQMSESIARESNSKEVLTGVIGLVATTVVLKHENLNVITSKAFSLATKMFRG